MYRLSLFEDSSGAEILEQLKAGEAVRTSRLLDVDVNDTAQSSANQATETNIVSHTTSSSQESGYPIMYSV